MRKSDTIEGLIDKAEYCESELNLEIKRLKNTNRFPSVSFNSLSNALDRRALALRSLKRLIKNKVNKMRQGKFEIFIDKKGEYRFRLKSPNGQIVATGEGYTRLSGCEKGIKAVKRLAGSPVVYKGLKRNGKNQRNI